ncbi:ABC transporter ATP-binding protein [Rhizobium sp. P38BS-XIX]|uniref:ABC transporter ATP-binding protein n=1 Tax=Rhizobium sp. P38BS-XIX TaxID=2726740 RepID=UPI001456691F|nr:ABC transporter ATP-binding protein [Rhizobium sp. P38BS-XIX]NLR97460.1 ABC transporter ATP-binding protein [Rhizobium sp. P38BS-XIX]
MVDVDREFTAAQEVLRLSNLNVGYGGHLVIVGVDLLMQRGDIVGLLGANGSGKSTLIKAITGQLRPSAGEIVVDGIDLARTPERAKARFGLAVDVADLPQSLSGQQYLELVASLRSCPAADWPDSNLPARLGMSAWLDRPIGEYSLGTRAKISIAAALLGSPPLLIFDECLNGLDPLAAWEMKSLMMELAASGRHAVLISTHDLETVPRLCNRAVFLARGKVARSWEPDDLARMRPTPGAFEECVIGTLKAQLEVPPRFGI